jgi:hypothetical protein
MCTGILPIEHVAKEFQACFQEDGTTILEEKPLDPAFKELLNRALVSEERIEMATRLAVKAFWKDVLKDDIFDVLFNILFPVFLCTPRKERRRIGQSGIRCWALI